MSEHATVSENDSPASAAAEPVQPTLHTAVDVRSASLAVLAVIATAAALHLAQAVFVPLLVGLMVSYALSPLVDHMARWRVPRALGAALVIGSLGASLAWTALALSDDAAALIESLPDAAQKVRQTVRAQRGPGESAIDKVQRAAADLAQVAQEGSAGRPASPRGVTRVSVERAPFDIKDYLWSGTIGVAASASQALVIMFIAYFLMASGNSFRRKVVRITGPTFARRRITVEVLDQITQQVHRFLLVQTFTSLLVGVATGLALWALGLQHAAVWGVLACVLNFVPYVGSLTLCVTSALVAFVQFGALAGAFQVAAATVAIHIVSGNLLTPWLTSRTSSLNPVCVFVGVLGFGWLWGLWGLLLGVPIMTTVKVVCDRVDGLQPIGELLGN